jgi:hypothetical protein
LVGVTERVPTNGTNVGFCDFVCTPSLPAFALNPSSCAKAALFYFTADRYLLSGAIPGRELKMASSVDIITLDNFQSKMPKWDPTASSHLFALVDMGRYACPSTFPHNAWQAAVHVG